MIPTYGLVLAAVLAAAGADPRQDNDPRADSDPRANYDVEAYRFEWAVVPAEKRLEGVVEVTARALVDGLELVRLDLKPHLEVRAVELVGGGGLEWTHEEERLDVSLPAELDADATFALRVRYGGHPQAENDFGGFHWKQTESGAPWIGTSCQGSGAHDWYPCKASYYHPEDKPERTETLLVVPADLYGVTNGRLVEVVDGTPEWFEPQDGKWRTFHWRHPYPLETYSVTLNVAPYVVVEQELRLEGIDEPVPWIYYVLPEHEERAAVQFAQMPGVIEAYSRAFGPYPFPDSKIALVETSFWGMEHSTAVAYGSSFPAWCEENGQRDPYGRRNRLFDYILVHETAHEWWGNAVSASDWGHFWIHEGFGTYAEGVYLELTEDRAAADAFFTGQARRSRGPRGRLYRGEEPTSGQAYSGLIYSKGACVLNTLRHYVADDEAWWQSLRDFNLEYRYRNADTEDFQAVLERNTGREWGRFFEEWFYGSGAPELVGSVSVEGRTIRVEVDNATGTFHVPLDLAWKEGRKERAERVWIEPGENELSIECKKTPEELELVHLERVLGDHRVEVR